MSKSFSVTWNILDPQLFFLRYFLPFEIRLLCFKIHKDNKIQSPSTNVESGVKTFREAKNLVDCRFNPILFVLFILALPDVAECVLQEYLVYPIDHCLDTLFPCVGVVIPKVQDVPWPLHMMVVIIPPDQCADCVLNLLCFALYRLIHLDQLFFIFLSIFLAYSSNERDSTSWRLRATHWISNRIRQPVLVILKNCLPPPIDCLAKVVQHQMSPNWLNKQVSS